MALFRWAICFTDPAPVEVKSAPAAAVRRRVMSWT